MHGEEILTEKEKKYIKKSLTRRYTSHKMPTYIASFIILIFAIIYSINNIKAGNYTDALKLIGIGMLPAIASGFILYFKNKFFGNKLNNFKKGNYYASREILEYVHKKDAIDYSKSDNRRITEYYCDTDKSKYVPMEDIESYQRATKGTPVIVLTFDEQFREVFIVDDNVENVFNSRR